MAEERENRVQDASVEDHHQLTQVTSKGGQSSNILDGSTPQVKGNSSTSKGSNDISRVNQVSEPESYGHVDRSKDEGTVDDDVDQSPDYEDSDVDPSEDCEGAINDNIDRNHGYGGTINDNHDDVDRLQDEECIDDDVEPDTIPSNLGPGFVNFPYSGHQLDHGGAFAQVPPSRTSGLDLEREPSTIVQQIDEMYRYRRQFDEANHLRMMDMVATLMQEMEMLSLQNKDLKQQVRCLKEENSHLRTSPGGLVKEVGQLQETEMLSLQNKDLEQQVKRLKKENSHLQTSSEELVKEVNRLYQNMKQAVDRVCYLQERCKELELPQAEQGHIESEPMCDVDQSDKSDAKS
ncbi:uncharacterized protein LOC121426960 [Lytechinus variegatus]|uniref:uncharacterized protein LOC121426960 n=1 Tax=Lytechinus variegatus TaxID=7654 RepID=UPI001BB2A182|nr:uncharacterized protein LOC121426960 [Lytechinus variegatus]